MTTRRVSVAEQRVRDAEEAMRNVDRRILNAQAAIAIFPLFIGAMIALYSLGDSVLFAIAVGFGSILMAGIGLWIVQNSDLARERQRAWDAFEAARRKLPGWPNGGGHC